MTGAPKQIWIDNEPYEKHWHEGEAPSRKQYPHMLGKYVRADIAKAERDALRAQIAAATAHADKDVRQTRAENGRLRAQLATAREEMSALSSYLGAGLGGDDTSVSDFAARIRWGLDNQNMALIYLCAEKIEEMSKRPGTTWGEVKSSILTLLDTPPAQPEKG